MTIAIILGTHGSAAEQLLKTTEMILGQQSNVAFIDFVAGENADTLERKYRQKMQTLDLSTGLIFLVDMWGGSPFNAASRIAEQIENCEIITGVNIPMLIETFMARDDDPNLNELTQTALESGKSGIKSLKNTAQTPTEKPQTPTQSPTSHSPLLTGHMQIGLARIDDRLIHGQVATRWTKETGVSRIIVVSDEVAADSVRKTLLTQVAPPGVSAHVVDIAKAIRVYNNPKYAKDKVMLLFTNPRDALRVIEGGIDITSINIGGMAYRAGKKQITDAVCIDDDDIAAFKKLNQLGIELEVRKVASDNKINMMTLLNKGD